MSSAAVHPQSTPSQYTPNTPAGRDRYASASPSSRRSGRNVGSNAASPNAALQAQYTSPSSSSAMTTPRASATQASPAEPLSNSTYQQFYPDSAASGPAVPLPIRTSSQNAATSTAAYDNRGYSSRSQQQGSGYGSESDRQRTQKSPRDDGSSQRTRNVPSQSRSTTAVGQPPIDSSLPRENSAIIQHIVVDDPQSDIAREKARVAEARPTQVGTEGGAPPMTDQSIPPDPDKHRSRQDFKQSSHRKEVKFGDYILGQTLGEGEFGKVKMGWKKDSSVQVAIKLIRKESLQSNSSRLPKIYREISILRELRHPNIVRLHEFVETERHMGIILEYASGGELFDYILNHRYLKDPAARRLFAQLVSGVGYLHKKGIVHRDLKLENLLLDRNRNIIITDFGFANTFNPSDELGEIVEQRITDKEYVKREGLDQVNDKNQRRGDLMQTSCGSPCYAAPELVVSDGLYTGRKVDVWSCGVILYAMLAGYLPFDDDPANPEGDNINLLYKYIVSTPLTFPEYVTPHARDILRRILVPDPRKRADLFEVARHSWLSEYSHVVGFIGSTAKSDRDIATSAAQPVDEPLLARSASVREPTSRSPAPASAGAAQKQPANISDAEENQKDAKRRTVQLEYVPPLNATTRGEVGQMGTQAQSASTSSARTRARGDAQGPVEAPLATSRDNQVPRKEVPSQAMPPPSRSTRDQIRGTPDSNAVGGQPLVSQSRPNTSGTLGSARLPSRGNSYSQPAIATPTTTNAQGHFSQPKSSSGYIISGPMGADQPSDSARPSTQQNLAQYQQQPPQEQKSSAERSHKRSSTLGSIGDRLLGRSNSRRRESQQDPSAATTDKRSRKYPPVSMRNNMPAGYDDAQPRPSTESSRRPSFGFSRKSSDVPQPPDSRRNSRRFSFLPSGFSMNNFTGRKDNQGYDSDGYSQRPESQAGPAQPGMAFGRGSSRSPSRSTTNSTIPLYYDQDREAARGQRRSGVPQPQATTSASYNKALPQTPTNYSSPPPIQRKQFRDDGYGSNLLVNQSSRGTPAVQQQQQQQPGLAAPQDPVERYYTPAENAEQPSYASYQQQQQQGYAVDQPTALEPPPTSSSTNQNIRPNQRKFNDEYDRGYAGSSNATRRVMDFFRRRGRDRSDT